MDKSILIQYAEMKVEIKDIRQRIIKLQHEIDNMSVVSDSVTGTRADGTIGSIRITGFPVPDYYKKLDLIKLNKAQLEIKEAELLDLTNKAEKYIETIEKSDLRIMFRLYYLDSLTWLQVADRMNNLFPDRNIKYTEDSCRKRNLRFFENVPQCPVEIC